jgi:hypothetical protein
MTDDDRIDYLTGGSSGALGDDERAELDGLRSLLADPAVWTDPSAALEERVVAAVSTEATRAGAAEPARARRRRAHRRRPARARPWIVGAVGAAAAVVVVVALVGGLASRGSGATRLDVALAAVGAPGPHGAGTLTRTDAGWRIELDLVGLAREDNGTYYQAWLKNAAGVLVPIGTFNQGGHVTLWAGVSPVDYPTFTVTIEAADGNQASSGNRVLAGTVVARAK